jgi:transketolase
MSDGEFQEGQTWEAFMAMANHKIDNLTVLVDVNNQQVDGAMTDVMRIEPLPEKLTAFGAEVVKVDGHDVDAIIEATRVERAGRPLVVLCYTCPFQGLDLLKERFPYLHYVHFRSEEERERYRDLLNTMRSEEASNGDA